MHDGLNLGISYVLKAAPLGKTYGTIDTILAPILYTRQWVESVILHEYPSQIRPC